MRVECIGVWKVVCPTNCACTESGLERAPVCRIAKGLAEGAQTADAEEAAARGRNTLTRASRQPTIDWVDKDAQWWRGCSKATLQSARHECAKLFVLFVRAFVAVVVSQQRGSGNQAFNTAILGEWRAAREAAEPGPGETVAHVPMSAVIYSFRLAGSKVFLMTLQTLAWAGHIGCYSTLHGYRLAVQRSVDAYFSFRAGDGQAEGEAVRTSDSVGSSRVYVYRVYVLYSAYIISILIQ